MTDRDAVDPQLAALYTAALRALPLPFTPMGDAALARRLSQSDPEEPTDEPA